MNKRRDNAQHRTEHITGSAGTNKNTTLKPTIALWNGQRSNTLLNYLWSKTEIQSNYSSTEQHLSAFAGNKWHLISPMFVLISNNLSAGPTLRGHFISFHWGAPFLANQFMEWCVRRFTAAALSANKPRVSWTLKLISSYSAMIACKGKMQRHTPCRVAIGA